jgi:AcrR family transcriptional regulator
MTASASHTKLATSDAKAARATSPRKPVQKRSRERFERLLDAVESLLLEHEPTTVGLYDIAKQANVPPASVYHFFPTKEAAFVALAERYLERLNEMTRNTPLDRSHIRHWSDLYVLGSDRLFTFYNDNPVLLKLFFGSGLNAEIHNRDLDYIKRLSEDGYNWMNAYFEMPYIPEPEIKFSIIYAIYDGVTSASYQRHGSVTQDYRDGLISAVLAYCRTFLPEVIPLRPPPAQDQ